MATSPTSPVPHKSKDFVSLNDNFGYALEIEGAFQAIRQFEIRTASRYCVFYAKHFGKEGKTVRRAAIHKTLSVLGTKPRSWPQVKSSVSLSYLPAFI